MDLINEKRNNMMLRVFELFIIVVFVFALWGVDSIINKFENKKKNKQNGTIL